MATEHPKPGLDAMCFKCDDYMKPGLPLRLLQFNHWRANSSPSLSFLPFHHRAGWASWPASPREPQVSAFPPLRLQAYATVSIFLVLLERVLEVRHLVPMLAWSALDRLSHVTSLSFVKDRHWFSCLCRSLRLWVRWNHLWGVRKKSVNSVGQEDILDKMLLSNSDLIWFRCIIQYSLLLKTG